MFWRKKHNKRKVYQKHLKTPDYTNNYSWANNTFEDSYCNAINNILTRSGFESLSIIISDDKHGVTVLGQYQGVSFALFFSCHSCTLDVPDVQFSTLEVLKELETGHYDKDKIPYILRYSFEELGFVDISTSSEDDIFHVIAFKDCRKYSFTFNCPFWTIRKKQQPISSTVSSRRNEFDIDKMDGHDFEEYCAALLRKNDFYYVEVTQGSGDQGIDIIAHKGGKKYGIQCKRYASKIGNKAVQEVHAGKAIYHCDVGVVLTNSFFTKSAIDLAKATNVVLWDRRKLLELIQKATK